MWLFQRKNILVDQFMAFWQNMTVDLSVNMVGIMLLLDISNHVVFRGVYFEFQTQKFPIFSCKKTGETFTKKNSGVISGKNPTSLDESQGIFTKRKSDASIAYGLAVPHLQRSFHRFHPHFVGKKKHGLAGPWIGYLPNLPSCL